jgi:hypothetical protein
MVVASGLADPDIQAEWMAASPKPLVRCIVLDLQQKSKFDLVAFCFNDTLHLFGRIPDLHIPSTRT